MQRLTRLVFLLSLAASPRAFATPLKLDVHPNPATPEVGENQLEIVLTSDDEKPITGATLSVLAYMPAMGSMPRMEEKAAVKEKGNGKYVASYEISMGGSWEIEIQAKHDDSERSWHYSITTDMRGITAKNSELKGQSAGSTTDLIDVGPQRLQRIGVKFFEVKRAPQSRLVRAIGVVEQDKTHREDITVRVTGYIAKLFTGRVGDQVERGQPLFSLYSPELVTAQSEFLIAAQAAGGTGSLLAAAEERLKNLGLSTGQIEKLKSSGKPQREIIVRALINGTVLESSLSEGSAVSAGQSVIVVGDLSKSYIIARVFQQDIGNIKPGLPVEFSLPNAPGEMHKAVVDLVFSQVEPGSGTANVRIRSDESMRPGTYVDVRFMLELGEMLTVPTDALLYSGLHNYVFVDRGGGMLQPREVFPGQFVGDAVEIRRGLEAGERVVSSGTFLLSSEAQLRAALPKWVGKP